MLNPIKVLLIALVFSLLLVSLSPGLIFAADSYASSRAKQKGGVELTVNGDPAPSVAGLNANYNLTGFLKLRGGLGSYNSGLNPGNWGIGIWNYGMVPMTYAITYSLAWIFTAGYYKLNYGRFTDPMKKSFMPSKSVFTYGGGAVLSVPYWRLTPTVGVHWARFQVKGEPWSLTHDGSHVYYSAGLDLQTEKGFGANMGYNFCPNIPQAACGIYAGLGAYF